MSWNTPIQRGRRTKPAPLATDGRISVEQAVHAFIRSRDYADTTRDNIEANLLGGRFTGWRQAHGVTAVEDLTADAAVEFLRWYRDDIGAMRATVTRVRNQLRWFAAWTREAPPIGLGLDALDRPPLTSFGVPRRTKDERALKPDKRDEDPPLSKQDVRVLAGATRGPRDAFIVELLAFTGMRPSELCGLTVGSVDVKHRPPIVSIRGSTHNPEAPKTEAGYRDIPLTIGQTSLPARARRYLEHERPASNSLALFLSDRLDRRGNRPALTPEGVDTLLKRLHAKTGIKCNPYRFRHTFCTWCADSDMDPWHLAYLLGHRNLDMVNRYYRGRRGQALLDAVSRVRF